MKGDLVKYRVYTLSDPVNEEIKYVGITTQSLIDRLRGHVADKYNKEKYLWIIELRKQGKMPYIDELEIFYDTPKSIYHNKIENYWIHQFRSWGFDLFNRLRTKNLFKTIIK